VVCHNPGQAERDAAVRTNLIAHLSGLIDGSDTWTPRRRDELAGSLKGKPGLRRYLRRTPAGLLRIDKAAAKRETHLDGKWLLRTSDATLTPEDLAAAYKQLLAVEHGWRDMKSSLGLRPVYHRREDRIRAHVQLCWLALLLIRAIETTTTLTWRNARHELDRMHLVTLATDHGTVAQRTGRLPGWVAQHLSVARSSSSLRSGSACVRSRRLSPRCRSGRRGTGFGMRPCGRIRRCSTGRSWPVLG
jgi:hypothetical protein